MNHRNSRRTALLAALLGLSLAIPVARAEQPDGNTWLEWRGPTRDGKFYGPEWPADVAEEHLKELWRIDLAESYSGPIVTEAHVFTTETRKKKTEVVTAFDRNTGDKIWEKEWQGSMRVTFFAASNGSWIRSTPACDGKTLFVGGIREVLVALDCASGEEKWRVDFVKDLSTKVPAFGFVCSPMLDDEHIYIQAGEGFAKLRKDTGKIVWRTAKDGGGMYGSAFSSPVFAQLHDKRLILVQTRTALKAIDVETGDELASRDIKAFRGMNILTPIVHENAVFTSAHSGVGELMNFNPTGSDFDIEVQWENRKLEAYMSSPVVIGDHAYMQLKNQRFACFELATGEEKWRTTPFGKYWSMVTQGDRIPVSYTHLRAHETLRYLV